MNKNRFNPKGKGYSVIIPFSKKSYAKRALDDMFWKGLVIKGDLHKSTKEGRK